MANRTQNTICQTNKNLRVVQGTSDETRFWEDKIKKCEKKFQVWRMRNRTFKGKAHILKSLVIGVIMYPAKLKCMPKPVTKKLEKLMWSFLWSNNPERVKRVVCIRNKDEGGLGMPDIQSIVDTGRIKLLCRIVKCDTSMVDSGALGITWYAWFRLDQTTIRVNVSTAEYKITITSLDQGGSYSCIAGGSEQSAPGFIKITTGKEKSC